MTATARTSTVEIDRTLKPYPKYKESGVEWLGDVPEHWDIKALKHCLHSILSGGTPDSSNDAYWTENDDGIPFIAISDITNAEYITSTERRVTSIAVASKSLEILPEGTLLYSMYASVGKVAVTRVAAVTNQAILGILTDSKILLQEFLKSWLEFYQRYVGALSNSNTQDNLNGEEVKNFKVLVPPLAEQRAIAAYLDRETARLDTLISRQGRLIELSQEKRRALMSHAVTRGLDETAPLKDSGVEWLGQVPQHWEVKRLKNSVALERNGIWGNEPCDDENDLVCVRVADFDRHSFKVGLDKLTLRNVSVSERTHRVLEKGDLLLEKSGGGDSQPVGCVVLFDHEFKAVCSNFVARLKPSPHADSRFFVYVHATLYNVRLNVRSIKQTTGIQNLDSQSYFEELVAFPPLSEQRAIVEYLDSETAKIDTLIAKARRAIELMKEHRSALIAAAVTGQIDVRGA